MIKRGLGLIFSFFLLGIILESCCGDVEDYYKRDNIFYYHIAVNDSLANDMLDIKNTDKVTIDSNQIYIINIGYSNTFYSLNNNLGLFNKSFTYQCSEPGYKGSKTKLEYFSIVSNNDWNDTFPAGSNLAPMFKWHLNSAHEAWYNLDTYIEKNINTYRDWNFYINQQPNIDKTHRFTITATESDGRILKTVTSLITFK